MAWTLACVGIALLADAAHSIGATYRGNPNGKQADFSVVSADLMTIPEERILSTRVVMTIIAGEVVFRH